MFDSSLNSARLVLVTGGGGRVGNAVVRELVRQGLRVRTTVRSGQRPLSLMSVDPIEIVKADVNQPETLLPALEGVTDVLHLASLISLKPHDRERLQQVNVQGTRNLLDAALSSGVERFTHMSSCEAYQAGHRALVNETAPLGLNSPRGYASSKAQATALSLSYHSARMKVSVVAPTSVIGPLDFGPSMQAKEFLRSLNGPVAVVPDAFLDVVDVRDVASATIRSLNAGRGGESYLLSGYDMNTVDLTRQLRQFAQGRAGRVVGLNPQQLQQGLKVQDHFSRLLGREESGLVEGMDILREGPRFDHDKATRELGFIPRPIQDTLRDTAQWLKSRAWERPAALEAHQP